MFYNCMDKKENWNTADKEPFLKIIVGAAGLFLLCIKEVWQIEGKAPEGL